MKTKSASELNFRKSSEPVPTVEIDTGSIPDDDRVRTTMRTLMSLARENPEFRATLYVHATPSVNFHEMTNSDFIGVAGPMSVLKALESSLSRIPGARVQFSDYIPVRDSGKAYHLEDGFLWCPEDAVTWYACEPEMLEVSPGPSADSDQPDDWQNSEGPVEEELPDEDEVEMKGLKFESPARYRVARADASIGRIKRKIEAVFGLPEGSVALCGPDSKPLRSDARIGTLRRRWEQ